MVHGSDGNILPAGSTRITFEMWTTGFYPESEKDELLAQLVDVAKEYDDNILPSEFRIRFEGEKEIVAAKRAALVEMLNDAETNVSLKFGPDMDDLIFVVGEDD